MRSGWRRPTLGPVRCYPLDIACARLAELVRRVERSGTRVMVVSQGRPVAVLVAPADLAGLEETASVLSCPDTMVELRRAQAEVAAGRVLAGPELCRPRRH
jgi:antitoxin YefM